MKTIMRFVALDLRSLRPYAKNLILPVVIVLVAGVLPTRSVYSMVPALSVFTLVVGPPYLFNNDERGRLDTLYAALAIPRRHVVSGRYATSLLFMAMLTAIGVILTAVAAPLLHQDVSWQVVVLLTAGSFAVIDLILAAELPFYFKLGAARARAVTFVAPMGAMLLALAVGIFFSDDSATLLTWLDGTSPALIAVAALAVGGIALIASRSAATRMYLQRDL